MVWKHHFTAHSVFLGSLILFVGVLTDFIFPKWHRISVVRPNKSFLLSGTCSGKRWWLYLRKLFTWVEGNRAKLWGLCFHLTSYSGKCIQLRLMMRRGWAHPSQLVWCFSWSPVGLSHLGLSFGLSALLPQTRLKWSSWITIVLPGPCSYRFPFFPF